MSKKSEKTKKINDTAKKLKRVNESFERELSEDEVEDAAEEKVKDILSGRTSKVSSSGVSSTASSSTKPSTEEIKKYKEKMMDEIREVNKKNLKEKEDFIKQYGIDPTKPYAIEADEFYQISRKLEHKHSVFYKFWEIGAPRFTLSIPTACVTFDRDGYNTGFYFNTMFWHKLDDNMRLFIISHEMLHVILNHGCRTVNGEDRKIANVALDIVVNHSLVNHFGFIRSELQDAEKYCWLDTVFSYKTEKGEPLPDVNKSFEYYFNILKEDQEKGDMPEGHFGCGKNELVDDHSGLDDPNFDETIDELNEMLSDEEKAEIRDFIENNFEKRSGKKSDGESESKSSPAGSGSGNWTFVDVKKIEKKRKWETIIKQWSMNRMVYDTRSIEQWIHDNRRYSGVDLGNCAMPFEYDVEDKYPDKGKLDVFFFLDTSGSCISYKDRFFRAAQSLPEERFNLRVFCFDTKVQETTLASGKVYGGGGTSFHIIEEHIQHIVKAEKKPYPSSVWMITDNWGDQVVPQYPERWHVFQTEDHANGYDYFPKQVKFYELKNYE